MTDRLSLNPASWVGRRTSFVFIRKTGQDPTPRRRQAVPLFAAARLVGDREFQKVHRTMPFDGPLEVAVLEEYPLAKRSSRPVAGCSAQALSMAISQS